MRLLQTNSANIPASQLNRMKSPVHQDDMDSQHIDTATEIQAPQVQHVMIQVYQT